MTRNLRHQTFWKYTCGESTLKKNHLNVLYVIVHLQQHPISKFTKGYIRKTHLNVLIVKRLPDKNVFWKLMKKYRTMTHSHALCVEKSLRKLGTQKNTWRYIQVKGHSNAGYVEKNLVHKSIWPITQTNVSRVCWREQTEHSWQNQPKAENIKFWYSNSKTLCINYTSIWVAILIHSRPHIYVNNPLSGNINMRLGTYRA